MYHSGTQTLIETWRALPGVRRVPARAAFRPETLGGLLPRAFLLERGAGPARFRVVGGWIEGAVGRRLAGEPFAVLWGDESQAVVEASLAQTVHEARPVVIAATATGLLGPLEITVTPLRGPGDAFDRILGVVQWTAPADKAVRELAPLRVTVAVGVGQAARPRLVLATECGRRIA